MFVHCSKSLHNSCGGVMKVILMFSKDFAYRKCEGTIGQSMELCNELKAVRDLAYLSDRVIKSVGLEAVETAEAIFGLVMLMEYGELLHEKSLILMLKGDVYMSYVWPAILYRSKVWFLEENEMRMLWRTGRSMVGAMCVLS